MLSNGVDGNNDVHTILTDADGRQYVLLSDGTDTLDINGVGAARVWVEGLLPDGVNGMPSLDDPARAGHVILTDGTETTTVSPDGYLDVKTHTPEKCFAGDYVGAQAAVVIVTPTAGKKIRVVSTYVSTKTVATDITLAFGTSGNIFFKLYTSQRAAQTGNQICALGAADETIKLTCGAGTFVSIGYDEVS